LPNFCANAHAPDTNRKTLYALWPARNSFTVLADLVRSRLCYSVAFVVCLSVRNVLWLNGAS